MPPALLLVMLLAQTPAPASSQTGQISGVVVSSSADAAPIRRAIVTISGGGLSTPVSVVSDDEGRFAFASLAAGRYSIAVRKAAYIPTIYGATGPGRPGTPVLLSAGARESIRVPLPRGGVITGTVRDPAGNPERGVTVHVLAVAAQRVSSLDGLLTDDRGVYRSFGLAPGEYIVAAAPRLIGSSGEILTLSRSELDARMRGLEQRHGAAGAAAFSSPAVAAMPGGGQASERPIPKTLAPVFFPGTPIAGEAGRIRLGIGDERAGVDIVLAPVPVVRVSGVIAQAGGVEVTRIRPTLALLGPQLTLISTPTLAGPAADGSFSFSNVPPGRYVLTARTGPGASMALPDNRGTTTNNPDVPAQLASMELEIAGRDVEGLSLALTPLGNLTGRIEFVGTAKPPSDLTTLRLQLRPEGPALLGAVAAGLAAAPSNPTLTGVVSPDGQFKVAGLLPGAYALTAGLTTDSARIWRLRSAVVNDRDLLDHPLQVAAGSGDLTGAVITFTDVHSELSGTLTVPPNQTADRYTIVVFAEDTSFWRPGARRLRTVRPTAAGAFSIMDLPAGDYRLAAVDNTPPDDWQQASFLEQLAAASVKVTIRDGAKTTQDIRIAK
jgi:hypothetical protein